MLFWIQINVRSHLLFCLIDRSHLWFCLIDRNYILLQEAASVYPGFLVTSQIKSLRNFKKNKIRISIFCNDGSSYVFEQDSNWWESIFFSQSAPPLPTITLQTPPCLLFLSIVSQSVSFVNFHLRFQHSCIKLEGVVRGWVELLILAVSYLGLFVLNRYMLTGNPIWYIPGVPKKASPQIQNKKFFSQRVNVREWNKMSLVKVIDLRVIHLLRQ